MSPWVHQHRTRRAGIRFGRVVGGAVGAALLLIAVAVPAYAHDPLFLTEEQGSPETGPLLPDGTISFALYGEIDGGGESRGLQVRFEAGDPLFLELLVPDDAPENVLADAQLPVARITAPDGSETVIGAPVTGSFFEPFTSTSYLRLGSITGEAVAGTYDIEITGQAPARFTFAVGTRERFGTPVERMEERLGSFDNLAGALGDWLETEPSPAPVADPEPALEPEVTTTTTAVESVEDAGAAAAPAEPAPQDVSPDEPAEALPPPTESGGPNVFAIVAGSGLLLAAGLGLALRRRFGRR